MQHLNTDMYKRSFLFLHQCSVTHEKKIWEYIYINLHNQFLYFYKQNLHSREEKRKVLLPVKLPVNVLLFICCSLALRKNRIHVGLTNTQVPCSSRASPAPPLIL